LEARKCLRLIDSLTTDQPEFWANLLGAIANLSLASVPDNVLRATEVYESERREENARIRKHLDERLGGT
jgi:hypothetical protein